MSVETVAAQGAVAVASEVRAAIAKRGLTASQAAVQLGWGQRYLSRRLTGEVEFSVGELYALGEILNLKPSAFLEPDVRYRGILLDRKQQVNPCYS